VGRSQASMLRRKVRRIACGTCGALVNDDCHDPDGSWRKWPHDSRTKEEYDLYVKEKAERDTTP
jgi:transcription initiation factor TFIIIB Brf1 subunit/transcription initiation factor TFIIB